MAEDITVRVGTVVGPGPEDIVWDDALGIPLLGEPTCIVCGAAFHREAGWWTCTGCGVIHRVRASDVDLSRLWDGVALWVAVQQIQAWQGEYAALRAACQAAGIEPG